MGLTDFVSEVKCVILAQVTQHGTQRFIGETIEASDLSHIL